MKLIILAYLLALSSGEEEKKRNIKVECINESGVHPSVVENAYENNIIDDPKLKLFFKCVMFAQRFLDDTNHVDLTGLRRYCENHGHNCDYINKCSRIKGETVIETAYLVSCCLIQEISKKELNDIND
ncbi:uncharacterized protein LOC116178209 isoform X2 [Photinus pyralis]|nr:uncharacterized protein LOC116178209 isoform X2 [Photinus pyralis]